MAGIQFNKMTLEYQLALSKAIEAVVSDMAENGEQGDAFIVPGISDRMTSAAVFVWDVAIQSASFAEQSAKEATT